MLLRSILDRYFSIQTVFWVHIHEKAKNYFTGKKLSDEVLTGDNIPYIIFSDSLL